MVGFKKHPIKIRTRIVRKSFLKRQHHPNMSQVKLMVFPHYFILTEALSWLMMTSCIQSLTPESGHRSELPYPISRQVASILSP